MLVMALDHANLFIAHGHPRPEMWTGVFPTYTEPLPFFTRALTHLAAPGFFFLLGAGMTLFAASRAPLHWTRAQIVRYFITRGVILILLQCFVENPAWIWGAGGPFTFLALPIYLGVLYGLGGAMILGALLFWLDTRVLLALGAGLLLGTEIVIRYFANDVFRLAPVAQMLLLPGTAGPFNVLYPILPWLGVTTFGIAFGKWCVENPERAYRRALYFGVAFLVVYVPLRVWNGFGNIRAASGTGWMAFLNNVKYPPSITFLLLALGIDLTLLFALARRTCALLTAYRSPLTVFGMTSLFFYIAHLYLYGFIGRTFFPAGTGILAMYPWWLAGLIALYPLCWAYRRWKHSRASNSLWRFF